MQSREKKNKKVKEKVIEEPGGNRIQRMKIKAQQKIRKTGIFVPKGI